MREDNLRDGMSLFEQELNLHGKAGRFVSSSEEENRILGGLEYLRLKKEYKEKKKIRAVELAADEVALHYEASPSTIKNWAKRYSSEIAEFESMIKIWETNYKNRNTEM